MIGKKGYVYIVSNFTHSTIYIGVTSKLYSRIHQHKIGEGSVFTKKHNCKELLYYEVFDDISSAITREKQMKKWKREWKDRLIQEFNPDYNDLFNQVVGFD